MLRPDSRLRARVSGATVLVAVLLAATVAAAGFAPDPNMPRDQVPDLYKWQVHDIFADDAAWEAGFASLEKDLEVLAGFQGRLGESAETMYECFEKVQDADLLFYKLYSYSSLIYDTDQSNNDAAGRLGRIEMLGPRFGQALAFMQPELLSLDESLIRGFLAEHDGLGVYEFYLEDLLRQKAHTLEPNEERLMALAGNVRSGGSNVYRSLTGADLKFPEIVDENGDTVPMTESGWVRYRYSPFYNVRKQAADALFEGFRDVQNGMAAALDAEVKGHIMTKQARGYDSCLEAALDPDDISTDAYMMLIDTIDENLPRTLHKYIALRRKVMGLDGPVTLPNLYVPMVEAADAEYDWEECRELLLAAVEPLGEDYRAHLAEGLDLRNGWIDLYPNANKESGAYSNGVLAGVVHPFIKMNFDGTLDNVFTMIHELGHSLHSIYSKSHQPRIYGGYTTFLAEIASTCNEELLLNHMLKEAKDPRTRLTLLAQRMENIRQTIFRQTSFAEFELRYHQYAEQGNPLTADYLNGLYSEIVRKYYGPDFEMGPDDEVEWAYISHFYRNFYVFTYATGLTSGIAMAELIDDQGDRAAKRYIDQMLSKGSSAPPLEILKNAGVDLETPRPIEDMLDLFEKTIEEFDALWTRTYGRS